MYFKLCLKTWTNTNNNYKIMIKLESPPAWMQEAYRPPCSECSFCCPNWVPPQSWPGWGGPYLGTPLSWPGWGGSLPWYPPSWPGGFPTLVPTSPPLLDLEGYPPWLDLAGYPPSWTWQGTPPSWTWLCGNTSHKRPQVRILILKTQLKFDCSHSNECFYRPHPKDGEGNVFSLSTPGGVPISHNALQHFPECHGGDTGGVPCQVPLLPGRRIRWEEAQQGRNIWGLVRKDTPSSQGWVWDLSFPYPPPPATWRNEERLRDRGRYASEC